jgi:hypothetical protein
VWVYGTPEQFNPRTWRAGVERLSRVAEELSADGIIADPETGWPELAGPARDAEARALGQALRTAASAHRVCVTTYPSWPGLEACADATGGAVSGQVQIYGRSAFSADAFGLWHNRWISVWGAGRTGIAIAGFVPDTRPSMGTAEGFRQYLSLLPASASQTVWDAAGRMPSYMIDALKTVRPSSAAPTLARSPLGMLIGAFLLLVIVASVMKAKG